MGKYDRYWEMTEGGPYDQEGEKNEIFKCKDCGAETFRMRGIMASRIPGAAMPAVSPGVRTGRRGE